MTNDIKPSGMTLELYKYAYENMPGIDEKSGFEFYQCIRDFLVKTLFHAESKKVFFISEQDYSLLSEFKLVDPAYIDNLNASLTIKAEAPHIYEDTVKIIDKYVRPEKRNEGLNYLYQECGAFLVLLLQHFEGVTTRQALHLVSSLTEFSESTIEKCYRSRVLPLQDKLNDTLPEPLELAAVYWTLHKKKADPDTLKPFQEENTRSKKENQKTIESYWRFSERVARYAQEKVIKYLENNPMMIFSAIAKEYGFEFPLSESAIQKPSAHTVFFILCAAASLEIMPDLVKQCDALIEKAA